MNLLLLIYQNNLLVIDAYTVEYFTDGVTSSSAPQSRLVYFDDTEQKFYAIAVSNLITGATQLRDFETIIKTYGEEFATAKTTTVPTKLSPNKRKLKTLNNAPETVTALTKPLNDMVRPITFLGVCFCNKV